MGYKLPDIVDSMSFPGFAEVGLKIITMQGKLVPLILNDAQVKVHSVLQRQRAAGLPMRAIILKARREGVSTYVAGRFFREINRQPMRYACVCSADSDATDKVFKMSMLFQSEIPESIRRPTDYSSRKEITYSAPHRSQFLCQTAGKDILGRGGLTHYLHCTEFAFWQRAKEQFGGAAQEVPDDPETIIVIESTANGTGGAFYDMYHDAVDRYKRDKSLDGYLPIFLPWYIFRDYRRTPPDGWEPSAEERAIQREFSLDLEQLYWRHWAIINKCQDDIRLFHQEYPATWQEAFQASGAPVFDTPIFTFQAKHIRDDIRYGLFDWNTGDFMPNEGGSRYGWQVLDEPGSSEFTMGVDTREHTLTDIKDEKSDRDYDGIVIKPRGGSVNRVSAIFRGRMAQKDLGLQVLGAARHYNDAWVVPEVPQGMMVLQVLVDYGYLNIYHRRSKEDQYTPEDMESMGYRTTVATRHMLVNETIPYLRNQNIIVQFQDILDEMSKFVYDKTGKPIHMSGYHDDLLFALFLAVVGDLYCPRSVSMARIPDRTGDVWSGRPEKTLDDLAFVGAIDDIDDDDDDWQERTI